MEIQGTIEIACTVEVVHEYLCDAAKLPEWIGDMREFELMADGSFQQVVSQAGRKSLLTGRITSGLGTDRVVMVLESDEVVVEAEHRLTATATGTRLDHTATARFTNALLGMLAGGMKGSATRHLNENLERLRLRLEL